MYTETSAGFSPSKVETQSRTEGYMFINGKVLLDLVRGDGPKEDFEDPQEYENDCFNVAKLIMYFVGNGGLEDYLLKMNEELGYPDTIDEHRGRNYSSESGLQAH